MFLVDTNAVSGLRKAKHGTADAGVTEWATSVPAAAMSISAIRWRFLLAPRDRCRRVRRPLAHMRGVRQTGYRPVRPMISRRKGVAPTIWSAASNDSA